MLSNFYLDLFLRGSPSLVKGAGLKILSLSGFEGSNPFPRTPLFQNEQKNSKQKKHHNFSFDCSSITFLIELSFLLF